jgi:alginate O-acetyltransferase complex protein AlgI
MIFNDLAFLFLFLPLTLAGFRLVGPGWREAMLLAASLIFYGVSGLEHVGALAVAVAWVWLFTRPEQIVGSRARLALAATGPVAILFYYKYLGFFTVDVLGLSPHFAAALGVTADKLLPAGVSFFTFHLIAYAFDRYHGQLSPQPGLRHFGLYICFFPHLVAGPILRYHDVGRSIEALPRFIRTHAHWGKAIGYVCFGLGAKVLIADGLSAHVAPLSRHAGELEPLAALYVVLAYSFQIYFDFYGYSLVAMGLAFLFGFEFPQNFDRPYESLNPRDFWRRWHMTLGTWIRDYLYIPLGGKKAFNRNILIVFALCGLWHGAAWQFVVWGLFHGLLIVGYQANRTAWNKMPALLQRTLTFACVSLGWILFLFDFKTAWAFLASLAGQSPTPVYGAPAFEAWVLLAVATAVCYGVRTERLILAGISSRRWGWAFAVGCGVLFASVVLMLDRSQSFIYFRF